MKILETPRLTIAIYDPNDFDVCCNLYGCKENTKLFDYGVPLSMNEVKKLIESKNTPLQYQDFPFGLFSVFLKENNALIGQIDLLPNKERTTVEIGFIFDYHYHGKGYAYEATSSLLALYKHAVPCSNRSISRIIATAHPDNTSSIKLLKKLGLKEIHQGSRFNQPRIWFSHNLNQSAGV